MKNFTFITLLLISGCSNPKSNIVERQMKLKHQMDSLRLINHKAEHDIDSIRQLGRNRYQQETYSESRSITPTPDEQKSMDSLIMILDGSHNAVRKLKQQYDSLEMELKN